MLAGQAVRVQRVRCRVDQALASPSTIKYSINLGLKVTCRGPGIVPHVSVLVSGSIPERERKSHSSAKRVCRPSGDGVEWLLE